MNKPIDGVPVAPAPDTRKPWEKTSWTCARARVDHEGMHCPDDKCADCPNRAHGVPAAGEERPVAWVDGAALRFLADPARGPDAYIVTSLNRADPEGTRIALYTRPNAGVPASDGKDRA